MLILAGVSISATVGDNGVLTKAKEASIASKKASILEAIDLELAGYNIDTILENPEEIKVMLSNLISKNLIDKVLLLDNNYGTTTDSARGIPNFDEHGNYTGYIDYSVMKDDYQILISVDDNGIYKAEYGEINISSGGSVSGGTTLVTENAFSTEGSVPEEQGKFKITDDSSVMFVDEIGKNGEKLSIQVLSGKHAKVYIFKNMTLTNSDIDRSAIDIEPGATLDLFISGKDTTLTVDSGLGQDGNGTTPGKGGYAGIHVPWIDSNNNNVRDEGEYATFILKGEGKLRAIGGNAGIGGAYADVINYGGSGGGGAGAGIGGNGGAGGAGKPGKGDFGKNGENCGSINICNEVIVYAYGGGGGSGSEGSSTNGGSGGAAGGYPAAGIGGGGAGGAGGSCCAGGGGYSGGQGEFLAELGRVHNRKCRRFK